MTLKFPSIYYHLQVTVNCNSIKSPQHTYNTIKIARKNTGYIWNAMRKSLPIRERVPTTLITNITHQTPPHNSRLITIPPNPLKQRNDTKKKPLRKGLVRRQIASRQGAPALCVGYKYRTPNPTTQTPVNSHTTITPPNLTNIDKKN